ncbi:hypothetical protein F5Y16DRAFT_398101 [Xylariaceae sp. FL0255]|nr:hypothetical protein F5Y16DRAFT_398101 [Xylariaceae sp. FL0255]
MGVKWLRASPIERQDLGPIVAVLTLQCRQNRKSEHMLFVIARLLSIVVLCTFALFLSGYVIQQRTLRDLRTAIRPVVLPRPKPKTYAFPPDLLSPDSDPSEPAVRMQIPDLGSGENIDRGDGDTIVVRPSLSEGDQSDEMREGEGEGESNVEAGELKVEEKTKQWDGVQEGGKPLSSAERRRRIKAEIQRLSQGDAPVYYQRRLW